jgi:hypothetical protein
MECLSLNAGHLRIGRYSETGRIYLITAVVDHGGRFLWIGGWGGWWSRRCAAAAELFTPITIHLKNSYNTSIK